MLDYMRRATGDDDLQRLAHAVVRHFDAEHPDASVRAWGLKLITYAQPLRLPDRCVYGAFDPLLRRVEIYACRTPRTDAELVHDLGHEVGHALFGPSRRFRSEEDANRFADFWLAELGTEQITQTASALRQTAREDLPYQSPPPNSNTDSSAS